MSNRHIPPAMLAVWGLAHVEVPKVTRCEPEMDARSSVDLTAVCARCGRRLTMDDLGGGTMTERRPMPECKRGDK